MKTRALIAAVVAAVSLLVSVGARGAAVREPIVPAPDGRAAPAPVPAGPECVVVGRLYLSEYGSRYKDALRLSLVTDRACYSSYISDSDGSFALRVPCGQHYVMRVEFRGDSLIAGTLAVPAAPDGAVYSLKLAHPGSYLELVRNVRQGIDDRAMTYELKPAGERGITKDEAIVIAGKKAAELGYDIKSMQLVIEKYNKPWNKYVPKEDTDEYSANIREKLRGKEYWAVYYSPKGEWVLGGDVCIFIDTTSGEIIAVYRGR